MRPLFWGIMAALWAVISLSGGPFELHDENKDVIRNGSRKKRAVSRLLFWVDGSAHSTRSSLLLPSSTDLVTLQIRLSERYNLGDSTSLTGDA